MMPFPEQSADHIQDTIRLLRQCPCCKQAYTEAGMTILEDQGDARLVHAQCQHCLSAVLALTMHSDLGTSSVGMLTDLSATDAQRVRAKSYISQDDLLDCYAGLRTPGALEAAVLAPHAIRQTEEQTQV